MQFLLFGTGDYYQRYKMWFNRSDIVALLDNSRLKQHTVLDGIDIMSPEEGVKLSYDAVVILSFYVRAMKEQLVSLGVLEQKIYHFYDLPYLLQEKERRVVTCYGGGQQIFHGKAEGGRVLLLSQELTLGGPPIALFHAARVLKKNGHDVVYASMIDGPLRKMLVENGIPVVVDNNLQICFMREITWLNEFSLIICNTINFHNFLTERSGGTPIIWWLHDAPFFYDGIRKEHLAKIAGDHLRVVSVGPIPKEAMHRFLPSLPIGELLYGVADQEGAMRQVLAGRKMRLVTIGFFEDIKGQDVLLEAISLLPDRWKRQIELFLVGHDATLFAEQLKAAYTMPDCVRYTGSLDRKQVHKILQQATLLICPSRQDSMPTVAAEAMMHGVPCLVSDAVGTAAYIRHGEDGLVFPSGDVQALRDQIAWCIGHRAQVEAMGHKARELYLREFSMETFERNFMHLVDEVQKGR